MASTSNTISISVSHAGQGFTLALPLTATLGHLRNAIFDGCNVPPQHQKLIHKGKSISSASNEESLHDLKLQDGSKVLVIGSKQEVIAALVKEGSDTQHRFEATSKRQQTVQARKTASGAKTVMNLDDLRRSGSAAYNKLEVLPGCPHEDLRRERLNKLSKDEAVLDCMRTREWTVGLLSELHPHKDPTLLGLNKNAGEAIYLRLLTDDLSGLRSYAHTRMVLLHELTHNKFGDHDESFKTLNSLLNKEVKAFEAAKMAGAHRLGGDVYGAYEGDERELEHMCGSAGEQKGTTGHSSSSSRARPREAEGAWEMDQRRQAILKAAEDRAKKAS